MARRKGITIHLRGAAAQRFVEEAMRANGQDLPTKKADEADTRKEKICIGCGGRVNEGEIPTCGH